MRPKRHILLVGPESNAMAERRYLLDLRGFAMHTATSAREAADAVERLDVSLAVIELEMPGACDLAQALMRRCGYLRTLMISSTAEPGSVAHPADEMLAKGHLPIDLVEQCRTLTARKRGPKKPVQRVEVAVGDELVAHG